MRPPITFAVGLLASLLACRDPNGAPDPASPLAAEANSGLGTTAGSSAATTGIVGTVNGLIGACPTVTFTLERKTITTNAATRYEGGACSDLKNGARVKVGGATQANGSVAAQTIGFAATVPTPPAEPKPPTTPTTPSTPTAALKGTISAVAGTCPVVSLKLEGRTIATTATTRYESGACADLKTGVLISVTGVVQGDGSIVALSIVIAVAAPVVPTEPKAPPAPAATTVTVKGTASEVAGSCPVVSLKLEGKTIKTTATTRYEGGACIDVKNGVRIAATGTVQSDGSIQAAVISVSK